MQKILLSLLSGIDAHLPEPHASLLKGIAYGIPITLDPSFKQLIIHTGLAHLIVLSGANITLLTDLTGSFCNRFGKRKGILFNFLILAGFIYIVDFQAPLMRAVCMCICASICTLTGRPVYGWWNLFLTILFTAILRPDWTSSLSFQLSVVATIGIFIWEYIKEHVTLPKNELIHIFLESWIILFCTAPICWFVFKSFSCVGPLSTMLASGLIVPLMIGGFILSLSHLLFPPLASLVAIPLFALLNFLIFVMNTISKIPFGYIKWN